MNFDFTIEESRLFMQIPRRLHHVIDHHMKKPEEITLHKTQVMTLMVLKENEPITMHKLGKLIGMGKGSFTQVIDRLVGMGYVDRRRDVEDRRSVQVSLTQKGVKMTDFVAQHVHNEIRRIFGILDDTEMKSLVNALKTMERIIEKIEKKQHEA